MLPTRVVLNFAHKCAMRCPWCYVDFRVGAATAQSVREVVERVAELGFDALTLGGGDPFQYGFIRDLIAYSSRLGLSVHVDTHGKSLRPTRENQFALEQYVCLLGLPIDGASARVHDLTRASRGHFALVLKRLDWLRSVRVPLKINTVVTRVNCEEVVELGRLVAELGPDRWSIYQYWPLGVAALVDEQYSVSGGDFLACSTEAASIAASAGVKVEVLKSEDRRSTYPLVLNDGSVFVHGQPGTGQLILLGSIFDKDIYARIESSCSGERPGARERYQ